MAQAPMPIRVGGELIAIADEVLKSILDTGEFRLDRSGARDLAGRLIALGHDVLAGGTVLSSIAAAKLAMLPPDGAEIIDFDPRRHLRVALAGPDDGDGA